MVSDSWGNGFQWYNPAGGTPDANDVPVPVARNWVPRTLNPLFLDVLKWPRIETLMGDVDVYVAPDGDAGGKGVVGAGVGVDR